MSRLPRLLRSLPVLALLCVPWYARSTPRLAGVEFFYWYQFAWVPGSVVCMLVAWLVLIFASLGYRAPRNRVVVASFVAAALLISVSVYLILDMNSPFSGPIQLSDEPLRRALTEIKQ